MTDAPSTALTVWDALKAGAPALADVHSSPTPAIGRRDYADYPGFEDWLHSEYAMGYPAASIFRHLADIRAGQLNDMVTPWPELGRREIDRLRTERRDLWVPMRDRLSAQIENAGILAKNARLIALLRTAEELESLMFDERNSRTGELYLLAEYRATLRQIAEEKGELGEGNVSTESALVKIAETLADVIRVQGSGVQQQDVVDGEWDYAEDDEAATVRGEGQGLEDGGVQAQPEPDRLPQGD